MKYTVVLVYIFLIILFVTTKLKHEKDIETLNETIENLEHRLDSMTEVASGLQRELHDDTFEYPFKD